MLDGAMIVWFALTAASVAFVVWDSVANGVTSWVQRTAWILVTAYTGGFNGYPNVSGSSTSSPST
jgi:hypothetical protein